jgi:hypothetical protein
MELSIPRQKLLDVLVANRMQHRLIFEEALEGYREEAVRQLQDHIDRIRDGNLIRVMVSLPMPEDHTDDYDRVIGLIDMSEDAKVVLSDDEYASYVQDDWSWKRAFLTSNAYYSSTAKSELAQRA